jgi:hypothetical protein
MQLEKQDEMWMHAKTMINGELMQAWPSAIAHHRQVQAQVKCDSRRSIALTNCRISRLCLLPFLHLDLLCAL